MMMGCDVMTHAWAAASGDVDGLVEVLLVSYL